MAAFTSIACKIVPYNKAYQPPNQTPIPCTTPTGKNVAPAISRGRRPLLAQNTIDVSHAEYENARTRMIPVAVHTSIGPLSRRIMVCSHRRRIIFGDDMVAVTARAVISSQRVRIIECQRKQPVATVARIQDDLRAWQPGCCVLGGDAAMYSTENLAALSRGLGRYILAVPVGKIKGIDVEMLTRPGRHKPVADNLEVKEVVVGEGERRRVQTRGKREFSTPIKGISSRSAYNQPR
jgi:hypothetical protein